MPEMDAKLKLGYKCGVEKGMDCSQIAAVAYHDPNLLTDEKVYGSRGDVPTCGELCDGRAFWPYTCACLPCILSTNACSIYCLPCVTVYSNRLNDAMCSMLCKLCGGNKFTDEEFKGDAAIGNIGGKEFHWLRANEVDRNDEGDLEFKKKRMKLFQGEIEPKDVCQGQVGDCWLIAAIACLSEHPGAIRKVFYTREANDTGKYVLRLYDGHTKDYEFITIDDSIPCSIGSKEAAFTKPNGNELWCMLLEKAFAKFCGSYERLDGGQTAWAWQAMTGDSVHSLLKMGEKWKRLDLMYPENPDHRRHVKFTVTQEAHDNDELFGVLRVLRKRKSVLGASIISNKGEVKLDDIGLVCGHAYSILKVKEVEGMKFVQMRNPWGSFEWKGAWSDHSMLWDTYPNVKTKLKQVQADDGLFWMSFPDFCKYFGRLDVCDRSTNSDLQLDVNEDTGACGPLLGCMSGCFCYWCCLKCTDSLCGHISSSMRLDLVERQSSKKLK